MTHRPPAKAPPRPFLAAAPEPRSLVERLKDLTDQEGAFPFETQAPGDWARLAFAAQSEAERRAFLEASADLLERRPDLELLHEHGLTYRRRAAGPGAVAALFADSEEVHPGMGSALAQGFPRAARMVRGFDRLFEAQGDPTLSAILWGEAPESLKRLHKPTYAQMGAAALAAGQYAVLRAGGFAPDLIGGWGAGELTALWAAGALDDETLGALLFARGGAMSAPEPRRPSGSLRVSAPAAASLALIRDSSLRVFVTHDEAPRSHVVGGDWEELEAFEARLNGLGLAYEPLSANVAFHSARAETAAGVFAGALRRFRIGTPELPVYGAESAKPCAPGEAAARLERQLLKPQRFQAMIERMYEDGARIFVEFGPGDALTRRVRAILAGRGHLALSLDDGSPAASARRLMEAAAALAAAGLRFKGEAPPASAPAAPAPAPEPEPAPQPKLEAETAIPAEEEAPAAEAEATSEAESSVEEIEAPKIEAAQAVVLQAEPSEAEILEAEEPPQDLAISAAEEALAEEALQPQEAAPPAVEPQLRKEEDAAEALEDFGEFEDLGASEEPEESEAQAEEEAPEPAAPAEAAFAAAPQVEPPAPPQIPPAPLTGAALALALAERISQTHERFLETQTAAMRAMLTAAADPETLFAIEESRREAAEAHRLYLEAVASLGGVRPRLAATSHPAPFVLAALAAQEADWPPAPEPDPEEAYVDPPERFETEFAPYAEVEAAEAVFSEVEILKEAPEDKAPPEKEEARLEALSFEDTAAEPLEAEAEPKAEEPEPEDQAPVAEALAEDAPSEEKIRAEPEPSPLEASPQISPDLSLSGAAEPEPEAPKEEEIHLPALTTPHALAAPPAPEPAARKAWKEEAEPLRLTRLALGLSPVTAPRLRPLHAEEANWLILGDPTLAAALARRLLTEPMASGGAASVTTVAADAGALEILRDKGPWTGIVYLHAQGEEESLAMARLEIARALTEGAQEAFHEPAARGERRVFAAVARLDGNLGYGERGTEDSLGAAAFGLAKALAVAEPNLLCRAVDLAADLPLEEAAALLAEELQDADRSRVELALGAEGRLEIRPFLEEAPAAGAEIRAEEGEIFVLIGDARGLATLWLEEAAARASRRFLILGAHRLLPDEPAWAIGITSEESLRWAAFTALEEEGADPERAAIAAAALSEAVAADRETRACLAELRRLGSEAAYATVNFEAADAADQIAVHLEEFGEGPVSVFYAPAVEPEAGFAEAFRRRLGRFEALLDGFSGADLRRIWFLPPAVDQAESLSEAMADEAVLRFAMGARAMGIDVRALSWAVAEEIETGLASALAEELERPAPALGLAMIGGAETALTLRRVEAEALAAGGAALRIDWSALYASAAMTQHRIAGRPALPVSFALAAIFAAIERFAPGWRILGCAGVAAANGAALGEEPGGWAHLGMRSAEWDEEGCLKADLELFDEIGKTRLRVEGARLAPHSLQIPAAKAPEAWPDLVPPEASAEGFYADRTLHYGPDLRFLTAFRMEEGAESGEFGLIRKPPPPGAEASALFDPALAEALAQSALAATRRRSGQRGLPMRLEALSVWASASAEGPAVVEARLKRESGRAAVWSLTARDSLGAPLMSCDVAAILSAAPAAPKASAEPARSA